MLIKIENHANAQGVTFFQKLLDSTQDAFDADGNIIKVRIPGPMFDKVGLTNEITRLQKELAEAEECLAQMQDMELSDLQMKIASRVQKVSPPSDIVSSVPASDPETTPAATEPATVE